MAYYSPIATDSGFVGNRADAQISRVSMSPPGNSGVAPSRPSQQGYSRNGMPAARNALYATGGGARSLDTHGSASIQSNSNSSGSGSGHHNRTGPPRRYGDSPMAQSRREATNVYNPSNDHSEKNRRWSGYSNGAESSLESHGSKRPFALAMPASRSNANSLEPEDDDFLHDPRNAKDKPPFMLSTRGCLNVTTLLILLLALMMLFAGYPVLSGIETLRHKASIGTNGTGQVAFLPTLVSLVDVSTPSSARTWNSPDQGKFNLVFSDEFNLDGRTFWPGDDPYWEAVDIWYGATGDYEWYSPEAVVTSNGSLVITFEARETNNLNFRSGMVQSWNKTCFQGGYLEFSALLPADTNTVGYWPGLWTFGNLGRPGYLGSTDGMWPYSYSSCDTGILPSQQFSNASGPNAAINSKAPYADNGRISKLPGMRASSCTCPDEDHPGPQNSRPGRSAPEIDILEANVIHDADGGGNVGTASQSFQVAPFDTDYGWGQEANQARIYDETITRFNPYQGGVYQEAVSSLTKIPKTGYVDQGRQFVTYGMEYEPDWNLDGSGYIRWWMNGKPTWEVLGSAFGPSHSMDVSQRHIPPEPLSIVMNLGSAHGFQAPDWPSMAASFPGKMMIDYVRLYQRADRPPKLSCDPEDYPTAEYINNHLDLYMNPNISQYAGPPPGSGRTFPKNKLTGC